NNAPRRGLFSALRFSGRLSVIRWMPLRGWSINTRSFVCVMAASDALDNGAGSHAAARAKGDEAGFQVPAFHFVQQCAGDDGAGRSDGVAEGHGAAIHVDDRGIDVEVAHEFER